MTTKDFTANVISATKVVPDGGFQDSAASGVWDINEALDLIKGGNWPTTGSINPSAFVDGLFSTFVYDGTGNTQTITNNINLSGSGGLVWIKRRDGADGGAIFDTVRGATKGNFPSSTSAELTDVNSLTSFNSNGFTLGTGYTNFAVNGNNMEHAAWTFRNSLNFLIR